MSNHHHGHSSHHHSPHVTVHVSAGPNEIAYRVTVPGRTQHEAWAFLETGANGSGVAGWRTTEFARITEKIRTDYKLKLEELDAKITARHQEMLLGKLSKSELWRWASIERTKFARLLRIQTAKAGAPVSAVLPELRDQIEYGPGGRTPDNLWARIKTKMPGAADDAIADRLIKGATKSNAGVSSRLAAFARYLEAERPLISGLALKFKPVSALKGLFAVAVAHGAYEVITAPPERRPEVARKLGLEFGGATIAGEATVGALVAFSATPFGWVVIAGLAAGVGGAAAGDWVDGKFFYHHPAQTFYTQIHEFGAFNPAHLQRQLPVQHGATGSW